MYSKLRIIMGSDSTAGCFLQTLPIACLPEHLPNAKLTLIPGTHFVAKKNPTEFNRALDAFLKTL